MPRRSSIRPASGERTVSNAAPTSQTAPMASAPQPKSASWSGARVESTPQSNDGNAIKARPPTKYEFRSARLTAAVEGCSGGMGSTRSVQTASRTANPATPVKTTPRPNSAAPAPTTGPKSAPKTAAPSAVPMTSPRRSRGAPASSNAKEPAHVKPLPQPWAKRAAASGQKPWTNANARLDSPISARPMKTARRAPSRAVARPPGSPPTSAPAAYAATSTPAPAFERWRSLRRSAGGAA